MLRSLTSLVPLALFACGGDAPTSPATSGAAAAPVEVRIVADDPAVRQRLAPGALISYFPDRIGEREPSTRGITVADTGGDDGWSLAQVRYRMPSGVDELIEVRVIDAIDAPEELEQHRKQVEEGLEINPYETSAVGETRKLAVGAGRGYRPDDAAPEVFVLLANRFFVHLRAESRTMTTDALWDLYDASGLDRLAGAPVYGESPDPAVPAWAAEAVHERQATPTEPVASAATMPACDVVLPVAEVERVCRTAGLRVTPSPFMTEGPSGCNRTYTAPGNQNDLIVIVSRMTSEAQARGGQRVASDTEHQRDRRDVAGLGDAATRYVHELTASGYDNHVLAVAAGRDVIEIKAADNQDEPGPPVCTLDQMETLARGIVDRLRP